MFARSAPVAVSFLLAGCGGFELPIPPNLRPLNEQYESPTAIFDAAFARDVLEDYRTRVQRLDDVDNLRDVRSLASDFDESVTSGSEDGRTTVEIEGIPIEADAVIRVFARCEANADDEAIQARIVVRQSAVDPTIWGTLDDCDVETGANDAFERVTISGDVAIYIPTLLTDEPPVYLIRYDFHDAVATGVAGDFWRGHVRALGDDTLELLLTGTDDRTAVLFGGPDPAIVGVRAANGRWQCHLDERRCDARDSSDLSFSY